MEVEGCEMMSRARRRENEYNLLAKMARSGGTVE